MAFSICPDNGPPRLWRFVASGSLGYVGAQPVVGMLLPGNLLKIDKELYDNLPWSDQHRLLRTHETYTVVDTPSQPDPSIDDLLSMLAAAE